MLYLASIQKTHTLHKSFFCVQSYWSQRVYVYNLVCLCLRHTCTYGMSLLSLSVRMYCTSHWNSLCSLPLICTCYTMLHLYHMFHCHVLHRRAFTCFYMCMYMLSRFTALYYTCVCVHKIMLFTSIMYITWCNGSLLHMCVHVTSTSCSYISPAHVPGCYV